MDIELHVAANKSVLVISANEFGQNCNFNLEIRCVSEIFCHHTLCQSVHVSIISGHYMLDWWWFLASASWLLLISLFVGSIWWL